MITIGNTAFADGGGVTSIVASITVTAGNSLVVTATQIDTSVTKPSGISGVAGVTFTKISEGIAVAENGFPSYTGSPTVWLATNVPAGTYNVSVDYAGASDLYGSISVVEVSPISYDSQMTADGYGQTLATGSIAVSANSITFACFHISPNDSNINFSGATSGWTRHATQNDGNTRTGLVTESSIQSSAGTISETLTITAGSAPWSIAIGRFLDASGPAVESRPGIAASNGILIQFSASDVVVSPGNSDHGAFKGLSDDDHTQYYNQTRGDARYSQIGHTHNVSDLTQSSATIGSTIQWNGTNWVYQSSSVGTFMSKSSSADQSSTSTTLANASELALPMASNGIYIVDCVITFQTAATTTGLNLGLITPAGCVNKAEIVVSVNHNAASAAQRRLILPSGGISWNLGNVIGTGVLTINTNQSAKISGILANGSTAGNFTIQFATEVSGSTATIKAGSYISLLRIA